MIKDEIKKTGGWVTVTEELLLAAGCTPYIPTKQELDVAAKELADRVDKELLRQLLDVET